MCIKSIKKQSNKNLKNLALIKNETGQNAPEKSYNFKQNKGLRKHFHDNCNCKRIKNSYY